MTIRNIIRVLFLSVIFLLTFTPLAWSEIYIEIIIDGSGSMWERTRGEFKIVTVREGVIEFLRNRPEGVHVGIRDFGAKSNGFSRRNCKNTRLLLPVQQNSLRELINSVSSINPIGKSLIALAIKKALSDFKDSQKNKFIILIVDGADTCNRKACEWLKNEVQSPGNIPVHLIGFNIRKKSAIKQLECIASSFNGTYKKINSGVGIVNAIMDIINKTIEDEKARLRKIDEEKRKKKELEEKTRLNVEVTNNLPSLVADSIVIDTLSIAGNQIELDDQKKLAIKESRLYYDQAIPAGQYGLTISYKKFKGNRFVKSRVETINFTILEGKTTYIHISAEASLMHYGVNSTITTK